MAWTAPGIALDVSGLTSSSVGSQASFQVVVTNNGDMPLQDVILSHRVPAPLEYAGSNIIGSVGWYLDNSEGKTHPVGQQQSNELELYDMTGNVWEWCWNRLGDSSSRLRVLRGGSWDSKASSCRSVYRNGGGLGFTWKNVGFRLVVPAGQ